MLAEVLTRLALRGRAVHGAGTCGGWGVGPNVLSLVLIQHTPMHPPCPNAQTTVVAIEALTRFREAVPFDGVQDLHIQIKSFKKALHVEWDIDENNAYQLRSAKVWSSGADRKSTWKWHWR